MARRQFKDCAFWWGTSSAAADITNAVDAFRLDGLAAIVRRAVGGQKNRTADGVSARFALELTLRQGALTDGVLAAPQGIFGLHINTAAYGIPMIVANSRAGAPVAGLQTVVLSLIQDQTDPDMQAVYGVPVSGGSLAVPSGGQGYRFRTAGIGHFTASQTIAASPTWGVASLPILAEGVS